MDRRVFISTLACSVIAGPLVASAQTAPAVRRIGTLSNGARPPPAEFEHEFDPLRELGWNEGRNLVIERRYTNGRSELLPSFAEELVRLKVELIVTNGTGAAVAVKKVSSTVPIILWGAGDPIRTGLAATLARPGGSLTGMSIVSTELDAKRLSLLRTSVAWIVVKRSDFSFITGEPARFRSSPPVVRTYCGRCGTSLTYQHEDGPDTIDVTTATLDVPEAFPPTREIWLDHKVAWQPLNEHLQHFRKDSSEGSSNAG